jgi:hypothetical protein
VVTISGDRDGTYALVPRPTLEEDRTAVVRVESLDGNTAVEMAVGRSLVDDYDCEEEPDHLLVGDVAAEPRERQSDHARAGRVTARVVSDSPALSDGRRGQALLLEWPGLAGDVVAGAWRDEASDDVYVGRPVSRASRVLHSDVATPTEAHVLGLGAFDLEAVPGGGIVMVTAPPTPTHWTADAGGADVLASTRNLLVVADPGATSHVVTLADEAGTPLDALVIGG